MMIIFNGKKYELFFSNSLPPLIALNYSDEQFFQNFEKLCGARYRILSVIRKGWQQKYGLIEDIDNLRKVFESKIEDKRWADSLLDNYKVHSKELRDLLDSISSKDYSKVGDKIIIEDIQRVRDTSAPLDAMSNMLHLFSSLVGYQFFESLKKYSNDKDGINRNFIYYTQTLKETRFAKIKIKNLKSKFRLAQKDENFSNILRIGSYVKDDVSELLDLRKHMMENLFIEAAKRIGCNKSDIEYLQILEIEKFLAEKNNLQGLIKKRIEITIIHYPKNRLKIYEGESAKLFLKKGNFQEIPDTIKSKMLVGQTASLGKVTGKVIIANNSTEAIRKMSKGNILVAPYTAVEYLPAMKKALAIITETGGITSHAAIVSRELKIPCIIAVKDATKILKDNQKIEVNADEAFIRLTE